MSKNTALTDLWCYENQLASLDVSKNTNLVYLQCNGNNVKNLNVSNCPAIVDAIKSGIKEDRGDYWGYGADNYGDPLVTIDKKAKVNLGNGESIGPTAEPTAIPTTTPAPTPAEPSVTPGEEPTPVPTEPTELETSVTVKGVKYKLSEKTQTATATGPEKKTAKTITIQATVSANNKTYKVTAIKASAFQKMTKLTKVTIGKNVKTIGKNAFYGCKKLKTIKINSKLLTEKKIGKNAFKGIYKKASITCPKGKAKTYKKWLPKKGVPKTAKIK